MTIRPSRSSLSLVLKRAGYGIATAETPGTSRGANPHYNPRTDPDGYELYAFDHRRRGTGAAGESQGAGAGSPGNPDHRMGFDPSGRTGNPGRSVRFHHQAVEQSRTVGIDPYRDPGTGEQHGSGCRSEKSVPAGQDHRQVPALGAGPANGIAHRLHPCSRADYRRKRHRQGADRRSHP